MKIFGEIVLLFFVMLSLGGCFVSDNKFQETVTELVQVKKSLEELRENIGYFQYLANDPKISFTIKDVEFQPPEKLYGSSSVKFKASLKQTNTDFPLKNYNISIMFSVLDENNNVLQIVENGDIINTLDVDTIKILASLTATNTSNNPHLHSWGISYSEDDEAPHFFEDTLLSLGQGVQALLVW